jgi:hypothetical protein
MIHRAGWVLVFLLVVAPASGADPIPTSRLLDIASGSLRFNHSSDDPFARGTLFGSGFSLPLAMEGTSPGTFGRPPRLDPSFVSGGRVSGVLSIGADVLELNGFSAAMKITAPPQGFPPVADPNRGFAINYDFSFTGSLLGVGADGRNYQFGLVGGGHGATSYIGPFPPDGFTRPIDTLLTFEAQAPVPEPSTVLLLGIGAATVGIRSCRRVLRQRR